MLKYPVEITFEALDTGHDRKSFECGEPALDEFLRKQAKRHQEVGVSRTVVLTGTVPDPKKKILGYFTLVAAQLEASRLTPETRKRLPSKIPCILLARLAVDKTEQGKGLGKALLYEAVSRVVRTSREIGVAGLFVNAKNTKAAQFYKDNGFAPLASDPLTLFQSLKSLELVVS